MRNAVAILALCVIMALTSACSTLKNVVIPTEQFTASLCAKGVVEVPCSNLGEVSLPTGGESLVAVVVSLAGPLLEKSYDLKSCLFTTYPEATGKVVTVTATAACKLNGVPVSETLKITLTPVVEE